MSTQNTTARTRTVPKRKRSALCATVDKENDPTGVARIAELEAENTQLRAGVARIAELEAENTQLRARGAADRRAGVARIAELETQRAAAVAAAETAIASLESAAQLYAGDEIAQQEAGSASSSGGSTGTTDLDNAQLYAELYVPLALAFKGVPVLREALEAGNGTVVTCLLGQAPGAAALVAMCREGRAEIVEQLLAAGANADLASVVEEEVEKGPSCDREVVKEAVAYTPLLATAKGGHAAATAALLEAGAVVGGAAGAAALVAACRGGHTEIVEQLIAAGAAAGAEGEVDDERCPAVGDEVVILCGDNAGTITAITRNRGGSFDLVEADSRDHLGEKVCVFSQVALVTPLYAAAVGGCAGAVAALLEAGATVRGVAAKAALVWACSRGHARVVALLVAAGASVDGRNENRLVTTFGFQTPLHAAVHAKRDTVDTVMALLDAGAALDAVDLKFKSTSTAHCPHWGPAALGKWFSVKECDTFGVAYARAAAWRRHANVNAATLIKLPLLKALLKKKGLRTGGAKPALLERLREALL